MVNSGELIKCLHGLLKFECKLRVLWNGNGSQGLDGGGLLSFIESILHVYRAQDICCLQGNDSQFLLRCQNCRRQNWPSSRGELTFPVMQQPPMLRLAVSLWLMCVALEKLAKKIIFKKETTLCISIKNKCWPQMPHLLQVSWIVFLALCKSSLGTFKLNEPGSPLSLF